MQALSSTLRNQLERAVIAARDVAEEGAWAALERLAVDKAQPPGHLSSAERELRVKLRAKGRQLGDKRKKKNGEQEIYHLQRECAYEHWHQMLFARFLAENQLLMHPGGVAVSLEECEELAAEEGTDGWRLAARYASRMLPQIFRPDDPLLSVTFAPEDKQALEKRLAALPVEVFTADDSLGWVYQFWQTKRKNEVNDSGEKIGADELPAVTQLFTEDYMVKFLLHNTLGAWWAGKELTTEDTEGTETEEELRQKVALPGVDWEYLRFVREEPGAHTGPSVSSSVPSVSSVVKSAWRPAAGTFPGWPKQAGELKIMDPCCGSGHFVVAAFDVMVRIRMEEEGLEAAEACDSVLRDNLFGLEIDQRCTQIAAFALAFAAWTFPDAGGYRPLPELHIACTGIGPQATEEQWITLAEQAGIPFPAGGKEPIGNGLINLHCLFSQAPTLGSLIDPNELPADLIAADYETLQPYLGAALTAEHADEEAYERAVAAQGMVKAAELLAGEYTLVITNVPYLGRGKQDETLKSHLETQYAEAKADLATAFVLRCLDFCAKNGSTALVAPQNWLFLMTYTKLRTSLLKRWTWNLVARLGPGAFETITGHVVNVALCVFSTTKPADDCAMVGIDASTANQPEEKSSLLRANRSSDIVVVRQAEQLANPDARIALGLNNEMSLLGKYARSFLGLGTGDFSKYGRYFWEFPKQYVGWTKHQGPVDVTVYWGGAQYVLAWDHAIDRVRGMTDADRAKIHNQDQSGQQAWGRPGVSVSLMGQLRVSLYTGERYDKATAVLVPESPHMLPALWACCHEPAFNESVREVDRNVMCSNGALAKIPFDLDHWEKVAEEEYPNGLPAPESEDLAQWLFHGRPDGSTAPLQVALARLLGYRWPAELDPKMRLSARANEMVRSCEELLEFADNDGIVCIPAVAGERTGADRLLALLSVCGIKTDHNLDDWLRDGFFEEHCQLFHQRPFIWHIWDGRRKDGFHALVNYHELDRKLLEKLIYTHVGDWIARQKAAESRNESGAEGRRQDAEDLQKRLKLILAGEPPYDIFVRWKPLEEQPIGWEPDLNDGVRLNIRPFVTAGVLRKNPRINWKKDRGKEPERDQEQFPWFWKDGAFIGDRVNEVHLTLAEKKAARENAQKK